MSNKITRRRFLAVTIYTITGSGLLITSGRALAAGDGPDCTAYHDNTCNKDSMSNNC